jgi:hypothetical protein
MPLLDNPPWAHPAVLALIGTLFGGVGIKVVERLLSTGDRLSADAATIRTELWAELNTVRERVDECEKELSEWKQKYFDLYAEQVILLRENTDLRKRIDLCMSCPWRSTQISDAPHTHEPPEPDASGG